MHIYLTPTANFGHAKAFLLREMLSKAAQAQHQSWTVLRRRI